MTIGAYWLLAVFLYSYFVLVPSLLPEARAAAQARLLYFVQSNRLLLLAGHGAAVWFARGTDWRSTYLQMAVGVGIGFVLRFGTNQAIARGDYQVGSLLRPRLDRAVALLRVGRRRSPGLASAAAPDTDDQHEALSVSLLVVPALLIPLIGYGVLNLESGGDTVDSIRLFLTSLTTVVGLGIVTLRLAAQGYGAAAGRCAAAAAGRGDRAHRRLDPDHAAGWRRSSTRTRRSCAPSATRATSSRR